MATLTFRLIAGGTYVAGHVHSPALFADVAYDFAAGKPALVTFHDVVAEGRQVGPREIDLSDVNRIILDR